MQPKESSYISSPGSSLSSGIPRSRRSAFARLRTLRWRLTLTYVGLLALLMVALAFSLNAILGRVFFSNDWDALYNEAKNGVLTGQHTFDTLVYGRPRLDACAGTIAYQDAFEEAIAQPLISTHAGIQAVYLLNVNLQIMAPPQEITVTTGQPTLGPNLISAQVRQLRLQSRVATDVASTGYISDVRYLTTDASGQRLGVVLIAERYYTTSGCVPAKTRIAAGIVEVVTTFPGYLTVMGRVRLLLGLAVLAVVLAGVVIGVPLTATELRPLERMTETARRIAGGDLSQRVRLPRSEDEIGQLARTFDYMVERIDRAFHAQVASEARMRQFVADASHELRTPLTAILSGVEILQRGAGDDPATQEQVLRTTQREAERMSRLIADLLTLARLDSGRPLEVQPLDLIALAGEAVDQARLVAGERKVLLETDHSGRLVLRGDGDRIKQVLLILLDNALKYGRQGADGWVRLEVSRAESSAIVRVSDNGPGIPPEDLPHVFDRFYRAERARQRRRMTAPWPAGSAGGADPARGELAAPAPSGSGLGLAIAYAIVRAHGGEIRVASQPAQGTTFLLALPLDGPPAQAPDERAR